jgi:integrase/recombinase XerD
MRIVAPPNQLERGTMLPDTLPRAIPPKDVRTLVRVINDTRDRALILLLLRTGVRIGEALCLTVNDIDLAEKKVHLATGDKNNTGGVVYLSRDALFALKRWLATRKKETYLFYGQDDPLSYSAARSRFAKYLKKARLDQKGHTVRSLRHTCASELLNAVLP